MRWPRPVRSNCFFFAIWLFWTRGGVLGIRRSRNIRGGLHFMWSSDGRQWVSFTPVAPKPLPYAIVHQFWYTGKVVRGDDPDVVRLKRYRVKLVRYWHRPQLRRMKA